MAFAFRRKFVCFYCGCRSAKNHDDKVREWRCENCEAVNFLDENGDVTEPPTSITSFENTNRPVERVTQASTRETESPFCATCLKNQHILTQTLANYLPAPGDPKYAEYESAYPSYRKTLEERYPQVCPNCEPRINDRLRAAGYLAKTDYLRRNIERTRSSGRRRTWDWRESLVLAGGFGWAGSLIGQVIWHGMGVMVKQDCDGLGTGKEAVTTIECLQQGMLFRKTDEHCTAVTAPLANFAVLLAALTLWWNNQLAKKIRGAKGRLVGLNEFYKLQIVIFFTRVIAWQMLREGTSIDMGRSAMRGVHAFMVAFLFLTSVISLRIVKLDNRLQFSFHEVDRVKSDGALGEQSSPTKQQISSAPPQDGSRVVSVQPFPINQLAPARLSTPSFPQHNPPTPPPDDDDADAMDWTPSQEVFDAPRQQFPHIEEPFKSSQSFSSFDRLPLLPRTKNAISKQQVLNQSQGALYKAAVGQSASTNRREQQQILPVKESQPLHEIGLAPPRFFPTSEMNTDTGLEAMMSGASLRCEEFADDGSIKAHRRFGDGSSPSQQMVRTVSSTCLVALSLLAWKSGKSNPLFDRPLRMSSAGIAAIISGLGLTDVVQNRNRSAGLFDILVLLGELLTSIALASAIDRGNGSSELLDVVGTTLLSGMVVQEVWPLISFTYYGYWQKLGRQTLVPSDVAAVSEHLTSSQPSMRKSPGQSSSQSQPNNPDATPRLQASALRREKFNPVNAFSSFSLGDDSAPPSPSSISTTVTDQSGYSAYGGRENTLMTRSGRGYQGSRHYNRAY
ncbi:MAG: hypothetical protein M1837_000857 [Sclerophora amabilis]|nr:MAG: hypothetical protein M1837_000857 [Sclerophora amabilis]